MLEWFQVKIASEIVLNKGDENKTFFVCDRFFFLGVVRGGWVVLKTNFKQLSKET